MAEVLGVDCSALDHRLCLSHNACGTCRKGNCIGCYVCSELFVASIEQNRAHEIEGMASF